jgi:hypothetical protein
VIVYAKKIWVKIKRNKMGRLNFKKSVRVLVIVATSSVSSLLGCGPAFAATKKCGLGLVAMGLSDPKAKSTINALLSNPITRAGLKDAGVENEAHLIDKYPECCCIGHPDQHLETWIVFLELPCGSNGKKVLEMSVWLEQNGAAIDSWVLKSCVK